MDKPIDLNDPGAKAPMPPREWLDKHTGTGSKGSAGAGWQEGWLAGRASVLGHADEPLTVDEHRFMDLTADLANLLGGIVGHDHSRAGDLNEAVAHIHALQAMVLAQAAARAYPDRYRLLGGTIAPAKINLAEDVQADTYVDRNADGQG